MLTFAVENFAALWPAAQPLMLEHWEEVGADKGQAKFSLDVPTFEVLDKCGMLQVVVARNAGRIVGYSMVIVRKHMHYDLLCGFEDAFFLSPKERKGLAGVRLLRETAKAAKARGVQKLFWHSKTIKPLGTLFERLGYVKSDEIYSKWL